MDFKYHRRRHLLFVTVLITALILVVSGCAESDEKKQVIIADQFGLAYAPLEIMRHEGFLERALTDANVDLEVVWKKTAQYSNYEGSYASRYTGFWFRWYTTLLDRKRQRDGLAHRYGIVGEPTWVC